MVTRIDRVRPSFVKFIPDVLADGVLYISGEYKVVTHRCCCGCGERVDTPLSPSGWVLSFNGDTVSLWPSIAGGRCNSHYVIRGGKIQWVAPLTRSQAMIALDRDVAAANFLSGPTRDADADGKGRARTEPWWRRLLAWARLTKH